MSRRCMLALMLPWLLIACGSAPPMPRERYYALDAQPALAPAALRTESILLVNDLATRGFLGGRQILFRTSEAPLVVDRYDLYLWEEPVPRAMAGVLVNRIRDSGLFRHLVIPADRASADLLLGGEVTRFEHRPTDRPPRVLGVLDLALVRSSDRRSLWTRRYSGEARVEGETPDDMARAFNRLAGDLAAAVVRDLETLAATGALAPQPR